MNQQHHRNGQTDLPLPELEVSIEHELQRNTKETLCVFAKQCAYEGDHVADSIMNENSETSKLSCF
jgi:hypothetical protein